MYYVLRVHYSYMFVLCRECSMFYAYYVPSQDQDGSHIKGLLINFFHHNWPSLLKHTFLEEFITPIVKVRQTLHTLLLSTTCDKDFKI